MKRRIFPAFFAALLATALALADLASAAPAVQNKAPAFTEDVSFRNEVRRAIARGLEWLQKNQNPEGYWSTPEHPAVTALALSAFKGDPLERYAQNEPAWMKKGYAFILSHTRPDGGIYKTNLANYNTAVSMMALLAANDPKYDPVLRKARRFLCGSQTDFDEKGKVDNVFDGGVGYGSHYDHSDMNNTLMALEALYHSKRLVEDQNLPDAGKLNWEAAVHFIQNCQNLPAYNKQPWVSNDPKDRGGFVYYPGQSMAGSVTNADGKVALRSYGSISYGGLLSYIYANLKHDDPRVTAVFDWLRRNYTLQENPGMGPQGLFYYFHTMAKALTAYGVDELELANGDKIDWRKELGMRLINLEQKDGSWINEQHGRWWEKDPALVTSYVVLSLEMIYQGMEK